MDLFFCSKSAARYFNLVRSLTTIQTESAHNPHHDNQTRLSNSFYDSHPFPFLTASLVPHRCDSTAPPCPMNSDCSDWGKQHHPGTEPTVPSNERCGHWHLQPPLSQAAAAFKGAPQHSHPGPLRMWSPPHSTSSCPPCRELFEHSSRITFVSWQ